MFSAVKIATANLKVAVRFPGGPLVLGLVLGCPANFSAVKLGVSGGLSHTAISIQFSNYLPISYTKFNHYFIKRLQFNVIKHT